jgi:hypothetical protein
VVLAQSLRAREGSLDPTTLIGGDAAGEEARVDTEPLREPLDRLLRRAGLAALDLTDIFLREPVTGEVGLGQAGVDAQRAETLT